jgi:hypothetical protein
MPTDESAFVYSYADRNDGFVTNTTITSPEQMSLFDVIQLPFQDDYLSVSNINNGYLV